MATVARLIAGENRGRRTFLHDGWSIMQARRALRQAVAMVLLLLLLLLERVAESMSQTQKMSTRWPGTRNLMSV